MNVFYKTLPDLLKFPAILLILIGFEVTFLTSCKVTSTKSDETYLKDVHFGVASSALAHAIVEVPDGGYIIAGVGKRPMELNKIFVARLNQHGETQWEKLYGKDDKNTEYIAYDLIRTKDDKYVLTGKRAGSLYLLKFDIDGKIIWDKHYERIEKPGYPHSDKGFGLTETSDGGYTIVGETLIPYTGGLDGGVGAASMLHVDEQGDEIWFKEYFDEMDIGNARAVAENSEGNFVAVGEPPARSEFFSSSAQNGVFLKRSTGDITYADIACGDHNICMAAGKNINSGKITVTKIQGNETMWSKTLNSGDAHSITLTQDQGVVVAGSRKGQDALIPYMIKLNSDGEIDWKISEDGLISRMELLGVTETRNGDIVATGYKKHWRSGQLMPIIMRTNADGKLK